MQLKTRRRRWFIENPTAYDNKTRINLKIQTMVKFNHIANSHILEQLTNLSPKEDSTFQKTIECKFPVFAKSNQTGRMQSLLGIYVSQYFSN